MKYQTNLENDIVRCDVCPRGCRLKNNQAGFCKVRKNIKGEIKLISYGLTTGLAIDPIEKKASLSFFAFIKSPIVRNFRMQYGMFILPE